MNLRLLPLVAATACLGQAVPSAALTPPTSLTDYKITSWTGGDGITLGEVRSIVQDQDGYLWLASERGLVRFDGLRFAAADLVTGAIPLPDAPTRAVYLARDGSLWVGYAEGRGIYRIAQGEVRNTYLTGEIADYINIIMEDRSGSVWVGHDEGLHRFRDGRWERIALPQSGPRPRVMDVHEDRAGTIWVAAARGLYHRTAGGAFEIAPDGNGLAKAISEDAAGRVWTTDETAGFRRGDAADRNQLFEARGMTVFHDSRGNLWLTTRGQGLWQVKDVGASPSVRRATVQTGLVSDENSAIFEDHDGNIWVASIQGLSRLSPLKTMSLVDLGVTHALAVTGDGTAWAGTTTGLIALTGVTPRSPGGRRVVSRAPIRALHTAADGSVWAATDAGLQRLAGSRLVAVSHSGPKLRRITSMDSDRDTLWVCDEVEGLIRLAHGRSERVAVATSGMSAPPTLVHVDGHARVWIAFEGGTVRRLDPDGRVEEYGPAEGLPHTTVHAITHDRWGDIWIGGNGGLSRLQGSRFRTLSFRNEVRGWPIAAVIEDDSGDLWIAFAFFGFIRAARDDVLRAMSDSSYALHYRVYNTGDGAGYPDVYYGGKTGKGPGGELWFLMSRGVTVFDPQEFRKENPTSGRLRIEGVTADDHRYSRAAATVLPPRTSRLRIDYTVVSLSTLERIRFRYRLDGFDTNWVDGTGPRQALYTNLPPGDYRFRLQASTNAAEWNEAETNWSFSIQPMFYQTRWFYSLCALGLVLCAMGAWQLRVRQVRKELGVVFGERIRLSREIHDTLLQNLVGLALQLDAASHDLREPSSGVRAQLVRMRRQVEDYIREVKQSIWDLRSPALDKHGLIGALRATGERLTAGKVRFALTVTGTPRPCPARVETHVLRIGHEALMNAVRHAEARQVQMEIGFDADRLSLRVVDDGRGFDPEQPIDSDARHYGLMSMKERAVDAGGCCTIESQPGSGVQVVAEFPLAPTA